MRHILRHILFATILLLSVGMLWSACCISTKVPACAREKALEIKKRLNLSEGSVIIVDYGKPSCEDRLYIYNVADLHCDYSGVVLHGCGGGSTPRTPSFSNEEGSNCSSLGLYKVAEKSRTNRIYPCLRLDGLDSTNSNARRRGILIHPSVRVTLLPFEMWGRCFKLTDSSQGCFSVSLHTYYKIEKLKKPIYIYGTIMEREIR